MRILLIIYLCVLGGTPTERPRSDIPAWDSDIPLDYRDAETPSLSKKLSNILSDDDSTYHFRKVKWGFSHERVEPSEAGNTVLKGEATLLLINVNSTVSLASLSIRSRITGYERRVM